MPDNDSKTKQAKKVFNSLLNISGNEWSRIVVSWLLQFFYRIAYIIAWTALVAIFATKYGILSLPYFFILYAIFRICGTYLYSFVLEKYSKENAIIGTVFAAAFTFLIALLLNSLSVLAFLIISTCVLAVFVSQLYIINSGFIEDLFTPLESERTFPVIESADTIGSIVGAALMLFHAQQIPTANFINMALISMLLIVPIILYYRRIIKKLPFVKFVKSKQITKFKLSNIKKLTSHFKHLPFLKVLLLIVIGQWLFNNLLEFQFTKAIFSNISEVMPHPEQELTEGLSSLNIFIYSFALIMQILIASRIITSLGIIGSLLLHPLVSLLSLGAMFFRFGFPSAVLTKLNFEMTSIIFKSSYHSSYYAVDHNIRDQVREIIEGFSRPVGMIIAMIILLFLELMFKDSMLNMSVTLSMAAVMIAMLLILLKNEKNYSNISIKNLLHSTDPTLQLNAIEVLGQKGHKNSASILTRTLKENDLDLRVKIKILETLGHMKEHDSILEILDHINSDNRKIKLAALKALYKFDVIRKKKLTRPFSLYRINTLLKAQFSNEQDADIKSLIINILAKLNQHEIVPFILELLKSRDFKIKSNCIAACAHFDDINLIHYLLPYLDSDNPRIKGYTIIALWKYPKYRVRLYQELKKMLFSENKDERIESFYVVGEIGAIQEKNRLKEYINSDDEHEKLEAAIALSKLQSKVGIPVICESLIYADEKEREWIEHEIDILPESIKKRIEKYIRHYVSIYINHLLSNTDEINLEALDKNTLLKLRNAYELVNEHEEVQNIDSILNSYNTNLQFNPT